MLALEWKIGAGMIKGGLVDYPPAGCIMAFLTIAAKFPLMLILMAAQATLIGKTGKFEEVNIVGKLIIYLRRMTFIAQYLLMFPG